MSGARPARRMSSIDRSSAGGNDPGGTTLPAVTIASGNAPYERCSARTCASVVVRAEVN